MPNQCVLTIAHHFLLWDTNIDTADMWIDNVHIRAAVPIFGALLRVAVPQPDRRLWLTRVTVAASGDAEGIEVADAGLFVSGARSPVATLQRKDLIVRGVVMEASRSPTPAAVLSGVDRAPLSLVPEPVGLVPEPYKQKGRQTPMQGISAQIQPLLATISRLQSAPSGA